MNYPDIEIIRSIKENNNQLDDCFRYLYKTVFKKALGFFRRKGLNDDEIKDLFQDSIIVFYEAVKENRYETKAKISTYLFSIMKHKWINALKRKKTDTNIEDSKNIYIDNENIEDKIIHTEEKKIVEFYLNRLKEDCKKILIYFYYHKMPMQEIAMELGYKNDQVARNRKSLCMKSLQDIIVNKKMY